MSQAFEHFRRRSSVVFLFLLVLCSLLAGCSFLGGSEGQGPVRYSGLKGANDGRDEKVLTLSKSKFKGLTSEYSSFSALRLIQVFDSMAEDRFPRYRVFGITPQSVWHYMGLENADVLLAAHDYVVFNPGQFFRYVQVLPQEEEGFVELQRLGKPVLIRYRWEP
jgi:hypothetical protein